MNKTIKKENWFRFTLFVFVLFIGLYIFPAITIAIPDHCYDSTGDSPDNPEEGGRKTDTGIQVVIHESEVLDAEPTDSDPEKSREPIIRWSLNEDLPSGITGNDQCKYWIKIATDSSFNNVVYQTRDSHNLYTNNERFVSETKHHTVGDGLEKDILERNKDYYIKMAVRDEYGWTPWTGSIKITIPGLPPEPPESLTADLTSYPECGNSSDIKFDWDFVDPDDGDSQTSYTLQVDTDSDFNNPKQWTGGASESKTVSFTDNFSYDQTYYWRVKTKDSAGYESEWSDKGIFNKSCHSKQWHEADFTTDVERATPDFYNEPPEPSSDELVHFYDDTEEGEYPIDTWEWTFEGGDPSEGTGQETETEFSEDGEWGVTLEVTDTDPDGGVVCPLEEDTRDIGVGVDLPDWEETDPFN